MGKEFLNSKWFVLCLLLIFIFSLVALGKEAYRYFKVAREINSLEEKISDFEKSNKELAKLKEQLSSREFLQDEARKKLNMVKAGEKVIIVSNPDNLNNPEEENKTENQEQNLPGIKLWLEYFFGKR